MAQVRVNQVSDQVHLFTGLGSAKRMELSYYYQSLVCRHDDNVGTTVKDMWAV
jgi:hypothetical protein